ncbi:MAG: guanylate kinase [Candidatus Omnitrophica bacterium]|nr:guanylate kinase [Candidatus Omnitrophota bacterium]
MAQKRKPLIIIVSAPSGSGKTTIIEKLLEGMKGAKRSVSYTTREPRRGEENNKDYIFVTKDEFMQRKEKSDFLEWEENFGHYYGTSKEQLRGALNENTDIILSIDVKGARTVKADFPESISIFIMPPSPAELKNRLKKRNTDQKEERSLRLQESQREMEAADEYDYLVVNKDVDKAVGEIREIIETERKNRETIAEKG